VESVKPNLKRLGARLGKKMQVVQAELKTWTGEQVRAFETSGAATVAGEALGREDILIDRRAVEGKCAGALEGLVAELDTTLTPELKREGLMRELINRVQQRRKEAKLNLTDRIRVVYEAGGLCAEILAAEGKNHSPLSEETLTKEWRAGTGLGEPETFPEHGEAWIAFRLEVL
jgi:isoleucyl-tRNA synthetase